ncbi:hypothetical protein AB0L62_32600 [Nocardia asteroides]|uniref:hypothetical protein n=1 Tax=Nocardia asteroides TaxID=1824 RepID=UPI00343ACC62
MLESSSTCATLLSGSPSTARTTSGRRRHQLKCRERQVIARRLSIVLPQIDDARQARFSRRPTVAGIDRRIKTVRWP